MPQGLQYAADAQGKIHTFPAEATPEMIAEALGLTTGKPKNPNLDYAHVDAEWKKTTAAQNNPAALASGAAALMTGGASFGAQLAAQGLAGMVSGGGSTLAEGGNIKDAAWNAGKDALTNTGGMMVGKGLTSVAPAIMGQALRINAPIAKKYGRVELGQRAIDDRILPTKSGADKAQRLATERGAEKQSMLADMDARTGQMDTTGIANEASQNLAGRVARGDISQVRPDAVEPALISRFRARHDQQGLKPSQLAEGVADWGDVADQAHRAVATGGRIGVDERAPMELARISNEALEKIGPGYRDLNRKIMTTKGVQYAAQGRADIPAQALENLIASHEGAAALASGHPAVAGAVAATRMARSPKVMGAGAIGMNDLGKLLMSPGSGPSAELIRAAIMRLLQEQ